MATDWRRLSEAAGLSLAGDGVLVRFPDERKQQIFVEATADGLAFRVSSVAGPPSRLAESAFADESVHLAGWAQNRTSDVVGF